MNCSAIGTPKKRRGLALGFSNRLSGSCKTEPISNVNRCGKRSVLPVAGRIAFIPACPHFF
jgi:hypothetical protein